MADDMINEIRNVKLKEKKIQALHAMNFGDAFLILNFCVTNHFSEIIAIQNV
jgi:hypothetical protein